MKDTAFDKALDGIVGGHPTVSADDLVGFAAELYRDQQTVTMPISARHQVAANLGLKASVPISNRTRRAQQSVASPRRRRPRWSMAIALSLAAMLALTGIFQFGSNTGDEDNRLALLSPAVPTAEATPSPDAIDPNAWLYPIDVHECPVEETERVDQQNNPAATWYSMDEYDQVDSAPEYEPIAPADSADANAVMIRLRQQNACGMMPNQALPEFWTVRWEYENRTTAGREEVAADQERRDEGRRAIAAWYENELNRQPSDFIHIEDPDELGLEGTSPNVVTPLYNPADAVELGDGRIAIPVSQVVYDDQETSNLNRDFPAYYPPVAVFAWVDGEWRLDETFQICIGECDDFWAGEMPMPMASPAAVKP